MCERVCVRQGNVWYMCMAWMYVCESICDDTVCVYLCVCVCVCVCVHVCEG